MHNNTKHAKEENLKQNMTTDRETKPNIKISTANQSFTVQLMHIHSLLKQLKL